MPDANTLSHKPRLYFHLRMDAIQPVWPKHRATIDLEPQGERFTHSHLRGDIAARLLKLEREINLLDLDDDRPEYDALEQHHVYWMEPWAVLELPVEVVLGALKRLLGELPPVDSNGEFLFSVQELHLIAAAMWPQSEGHLHYLHDKAEAEPKAKRAIEVNKVFADLRNELRD